MSFRSFKAAFWDRIKLRRRRNFWTSLVKGLARPRPRPILRIESLEPRMVLATVTWDGDVGANWASALNWDGGAGNFTWLSAANWSGDTVPTSGDDAVIPDLVGTPTIHIGTSTSVRSVTSAEKILVNSGTWTVAQNSSLNAGLDIGGATLSVGGVFTIGGVSDWGGATPSRTHRVSARSAAFTTA